jgi:hypothetical protein
MICNSGNVTRRVLPLTQHTLIGNFAPGRDTMFWEFRNWMVRNLQLSHWPEPCEADGEVGVLFDIRSRKGRTAA